MDRDMDMQSAVIGVLGIHISMDSGYEISK